MIYYELKSDANFLKCQQKVKTFNGIFSANS